MDENKNEGEDVEQHVMILLIYHRCRYMIGDHNERRRFPYVAHISGFIYELDNLCTYILHILYNFYLDLFWILSYMTCINSSYFGQFLLGSNLDIIIHDMFYCNYL